MINGVQYTAVLQNVLTKKKGLSLPKRWAFFYIKKNAD
jgi:hypothetical protein